jgi:hypothetical protein
MLLIKRDPKIKRSDFDPLHIEEELPATWNGPHVALRLTEAFTTVSKTTPGRRLGYVSTWPSYLYEFADLAAQAEQGELERTQETQNRVRIVPSSQEIARMEQAIAWPATYLSAAHSELMVAVNMVSLAHALGFDAGWCAKKRGGYVDTWRQHHDLGCLLIARGLIADRVAVF